MHEISDRQDIALAMIEHIRQQQANRESRLKEAQNQALEQTRPANDNQPEKHYNPITGQEMTPEAWRKMQEILDRANQREQERKAKNRNGLEY